MHGPHDRNFWDLCKQIEKEVEGADWKSGGHTVGSDEYFGGEEVDDHGGWTGGEFVLGGSGNAGESSAGLSRREIMARAADARKSKEARERNPPSDGGSGTA